MIVNRRIATTVVGSLACLLLVSPIPAQVESQPPFRVDDPVLELDKVIAGHTVTATWVFQNDGPTDVRIIRAKPS